MLWQQFLILRWVGPMSRLICEFLFPFWFKLFYRDHGKLLHL